MREKSCPLEDCCVHFDKGMTGFCQAEMEDIFDCFTDVKENQFRLKTLLWIN